MMIARVRLIKCACQVCDKLLSQKLHQMISGPGLAPLEHVKCPSFAMAMITLPKHNGMLSYEQKTNAIDGLKEVRYARSPREFHG